MGYKSIIDLQKIRGSKQKALFIHQHRDDAWFTNFLYYALNPMLTYKISEATLRKEEPIKSSNPYSDVFDMCENLSNKKSLNNETIADVKSFVYSIQNELEREIVIKLLSKTIKLGVTNKTVNKIIPNLIPEWEVQQAYTIDKCPLKEGTWFSLTQKLNGVRATYYKGKLYARSGVPYEGLEHITDVLDSYVERVGQPIVFDGELTLKNKGNLTDNEAFRTSTGIINSKTDDKTSICYTVFDVVSQDGFEGGESMMPYSERRKVMDAIDCDFKRFRVDSISILPVLYSGTDQSKIGELLDQMVREDKEGLMVNLDVPYRRRRHNGILKVKRFYTMDLPIKEIEEGSGRLSNTLGAFVVDYKGNDVRVGSGFNDGQRAEFWANRENLIGTLCEVKYKEVSSDKNTGSESLQFPVFVGLRTDKNDISYD